MSRGLRSYSNETSSDQPLSASRRQFLLFGVCYWTLTSATQLSNGTRVASKRAVVSLDGVAVGLGPLLADLLTPGTLLQVRPGNGIQPVYYNEYFLGWLSNHVGTVVEAQARVAFAAFDEAGKFDIQIKL